MDIWDTSKLAIFVAFVIPGFVSLKTYELFYPSAQRDTSKQLIDAVAYSCINYAVLFWPIYEVESNDINTSHPQLYAVFYAGVLFLGPVVWVILLKCLRRTDFFQRSMPHPTGRPWDFVFAQRKWYWIIVNLKDGTKIAGKYASQSFASSAPAPEQLFLEETWELNEDGGFERPRTDSAGAIVLASDVVMLELFHFR